MHLSLSQRLSVWKSALTLATLVLASISSSLGLSAQESAQSSEDLFRGTWLVNTPDDGGLVLIIKRNGRASYFWGENADRTVYQGHWTATDTTDTDTAATITWGDGSQHILARDTLGFGITYKDPQGNEHYSVSAERVPKEILGQWAKPPVKPEALASDRDKAKGFFGIWKIGEDGDQFVFIEPDRSAASTWTPEGSPTKRGLRGSWAKQGSELHIVWDSGHYSILREGERGFVYKRIAPGATIEEDQSEFTPAARTSEENLSKTWLTEYNKEKENYAGGIAFSSRKNARAFYRGPWLVKYSDNSFEQIEISHFGGLSTSRDHSLKGNWLMNGQDIFMRWDDGMRKILSPIGQGFVLYTYKPGRPLDGVPTTVLPAAPLDTAKLTAHLKDREAVAQQILNLAEAAGIQTETKEAGWGRTFMRWAWPFGAENTTASTAADALLQEDLEAAADANSPWWWPLWSEKQNLSGDVKADTQAEDTAVKNGTGEAVAMPPAEAPAATSKVEPIDAPQPASKNLRKPKKGWYWPF